MNANKATREKTAALPKALAERAEAKAAEARAKARQEALALVELISARSHHIEDAFYDIGEALLRLREPRLFKALDANTFAELTRRRLGMSDVQANKLIGIAQQLSRSRAVALGRERAAALVRLARATSAEDSAETLAEKGVTLPGRRRPVPPTELTVRDLLAAARHRNQLRAARKNPRWSEQHAQLGAAVEALEARLADAHVTGARVRVAVHPVKRTVRLHVQFLLRDTGAALSALSFRS